MLKADLHTGSKFFSVNQAKVRLAFVISEAVLRCVYLLSSKLRNLPLSILAESRSVWIISHLQLTYLTVLVFGDNKRFRQRELELPSALQRLSNFFNN